MIRKFNRLYLVGIVPGKTHKPEDAIYRLILETEKFESEQRISNFSYKFAMMNKKDLYDYLWKHNDVGANINASAGENFKALQGDFSRYDVTKNNVVVILGEIRNLSNKDELLGYRVATSDGKVHKKTLADMLAYCKRESAAGRIPVANGKFIQSDTKKTHIKSYLTCGYPIELIRVNRQNVHSKPAEINEKEAKERIKKLEDIFTPEQIRELQQAKAAGVNIRIIANKDLTPEQMHIIWTCENEKLPGRLFADPAYSVELMEFYSAELETGVDIRVMLNPKYTVEQLFEISLGYEQGVDISKYTNPKNSVEFMRKKREDMANKVWTHYKVLEGKLK